MKKFKRRKDHGFFDQDFRLTKLTELGDPLDRLSQGVDFELFRSILEESLTKPHYGRGGRRPYDYMMMFKILILQRYYNLSDTQVEFQINDRMSFMRFLNITIAEDVPDSKTVWHFREQLVQANITEKLFSLFLSHLDKMGLIVNEGKIVDASFVEVPIQRNTKVENEIIKEGGIPESFLENKNKLSHKDTDAQWTTKNKTHYYGYKNHVKSDSKSKIITKYTVTEASVHDSQALAELLEEKDAEEPLYADSAYTGEKQEIVIEEKKMTNEVCEKGYRNTPLTEEQREGNREKSKTRSRVEHIFGFMEMSMNGMYLYAVDKKRISAMIGMMNLTYNMYRKIQIIGI